MKRPKLGTGVTFKMSHLPEIQKGALLVDWFELLADHHLVPSKRLSSALEVIKGTYPLVLHCTGLAIGSSTPLNFDYLARVKRLADELDSPWISDHISWGQVPGAHFHDLLPLPHTKEVAEYVAERAKIVQDYLERPFALENVSVYVEAEESQMSEWEFCSYIVEKSQTFMLLDVNNIYVSAHNTGFDYRDYLKDLPWNQIIEIHLAGHTEKTTDTGKWIVDSHNRPVRKEVWELYKEAWTRAGQPSTLVEHNGIDQTFPDICEEVRKAKELQEESNYAATRLAS